MSEDPGHVLSPFSKQAAQFTWLIYDVFLLLILLSAFLFYQDLDVTLRNLVRLHFVHSVAVFLLSGLHLLAYHRHEDAEQLRHLGNETAPYVQFPAWRSYGIYFLKVLAGVAFIYVAATRNYLFAN